MWKSNISIMVRSVLSDFTEPYTYSDSQIESLITHAAIIISFDLGMCYSVNLCSGIVEPDPTKDNNFLVLCAYKVACMLAIGQVKSLGMCNVSISDGPSSINLNGPVDAAQKLYNHICGLYDNAKMNYYINNNAGSIVCGPIKQ